MWTRNRIWLTVFAGLALLSPACSKLGSEDGASAANGTEETVPLAAVSITSDVTYASETWKLDVYAPDASGSLPVIVLMHGFTASKASHAEDSEVMARLGAVVYAINAPVGRVNGMALDNGKQFREMSEVLACAIGYAQATAPDFGGDPDRVVLVAHSFGALYGAWFALGSDSIAAKWDEYATKNGGPSVQATCEATPSTSLVGFIGVGGGRYADVENADFPEENFELSNLVNPYSYLGGNLELPIRLLHGEADLTAPTESSQAFHQILLDAGHDSQLTFFEGGHVVPPELTHDAVAQLTSP